MKRYLGILLGLLLCTNVMGQQRFVDLVGPVGVNPVEKTDQLEVPYITWGGDVPTFYANGGLTTQKNTIFDKNGLKLKLVPGDDFVNQARRYLEGKTPFIRGTFSMLGLASEVLGNDPRTKPVVFLQLSWSAGDHIVAREHIKNLNDLKGGKKKVKIAVQQSGPHVGLLDDVLKSAQATWDDVDVVWVPNLTGEKSPAEVFRKDPTIDCCTVITPDMIGLTGGLDAAGTGAEGTVKGARVLVSTAQMSRSIADVYACRQDWYAQNQPLVEKFVAGYLKSCETIVPMRRAFEENHKLTPQYQNVLQQAQSIFGKSVLPTLEVDAHGLLLDCTFVGLSGNISFFQDKGNLNGFEPKQKSVLDLAVNQKYARDRIGFSAAAFDYKKIATLAGVEYVVPEGSRERIAAESVDVFPDSNLDDRTIVSFTINFEPNQQEFSAETYGSEFNRAIESASTFGNTVVVIRGHSDPTQTLVTLVKTGLAKGVLQRSGQAGNYQYFLNKKPLDLSQTDAVVKLIQSGVFDEGTDGATARETLQAALNLSLARADAVKQAVVKFAQTKGFNLDISQIQPVGAGILEPLVAKPSNVEEAKKNMRVEFRIVKVPAEAINSSDFDY